jgi:hypothetical protein
LPKIEKIVPLVRKGQAMLLHPTGEQFDHALQFFLARGSVQHQRIGQSLKVNLIPAVVLEAKNKIYRAIQ